MIFMMDKKKVILVGLELSNNNLIVRIYCKVILFMDMFLYMYFVVIRSKGF